MTIGRQVHPLYMPETPVCMNRLLKYYVDGATEACAGTPGAPGLSRLHLEQSRCPSGLRSMGSSPPQADRNGLTAIVGARRGILASDGTRMG